MMRSEFSIDSLMDLYRNSKGEDRRRIEEQICDMYTPLVHKIADKYRNAGAYSISANDDRIQDGYQGLLQALRSYDPEKDTKFLTYAFNCVSKAVYQGIREVNVGGKSKAFTDSRLQKYRKTKKELEQKLGRKPSVSELAIETGWRVNTVLAYERQLYDVASIENTFLFSKRL